MNLEHLILFTFHIHIQVLHFPTSSAQPLRPKVPSSIQPMEINAEFPKQSPIPIPISISPFKINKVLVCCGADIALKPACIFANPYPELPCASILDPSHPSHSPPPTHPHLYPSLPCALHIIPFLFCVTHPSHLQASLLPPSRCSNPFSPIEFRRSHYLTLITS